MAHLTNIAIHHFGPRGNDPLSKSAYLTESEINLAHKNRWSDFPSELNGSFIGYNVIIYPNGELKQYRFLGEETAAQKGHNFDTFSICLAGNFTKGVESPTVSQVMRLKSLLHGLLHGDMVSISIKTKNDATWYFERKNVLPHRILQPYHTDCYGNSLSDTWARDLIFIPGEEVEKLTLLLSLYKKLKDLYMKQKLMFGGKLESCSTADVRG